MFLIPGFAQCTGDFNDDNSLFIINCAAFDDSETIVSATYSLNGNDMGTGTYSFVKVQSPNSYTPISSQLCFHCHLLCHL